MEVCVTKRQFEEHSKVSLMIYSCGTLTNHHSFLGLNDILILYWCSLAYHVLFHSVK